MTAVLAGKVALVTGGGSGLGRASSVALARAGATVVVSDVNLAGAQETVDAIVGEGGTADARTCDVSEAEQCGELIAGIERDHGGLHVLHNNAGVALIGRDGFAPNIAPADWDKVIAINLSGTFYCCHFAIPVMQRSGGGSIINTASSMAHLPLGGMDGYAASKHTVAGLTKSLAPSCGPIGIRVNPISPGYVDTPMNAMIFGVDSIKSEFEIEHASGLQDPEEIADTVVFLASDASRSFNGAILNCDRGWTSFKMPDALRRMNLPN